MTCSNCWRVLGIIIFICAILVILAIRTPSIVPGRKSATSFFLQAREGYTNNNSNADSETLAAESGKLSSLEEGELLPEEDRFIDALVNQRDLSLDDQKLVWRSMQKRVNVASINRTLRIFNARLPPGAPSFRSIHDVPLRSLLCQQYCLAHHFILSKRALYLQDDTNVGCSAWEQHFGIDVASCTAAAAAKEGERVPAVIGNCGSPLVFSEQDTLLLTEVYLFATFRKHMETEARRSAYAFYRKPLSTGATLDDLLMVNTTESAHSTEGVCVPTAFADMSTLPAKTQPQWQAVRPWSEDELRITLMADLDVVIHAIVDDGRQSGIPGGLSSALKNGTSPICMLPKQRAVVTFAVRNRWMFDVHRPSVTESDVVDLQMETEKVTNETTTTFSATLSARSARSLKKLGARNNPLFYQLRNVVMPSHPDSGQPQGYGVRSTSLDLLRDERWIRIRNYAVHSRATSPRFLVRGKKLFLFPVIFASNNIGHVMFRYYSVTNLLRKMRYDPSEYVFAYVVLMSSAATFGPHNMYKVYYQAMHERWVSFFGAHGKARESNLDLCFEQGLSGFGGIAQFHRGYQPQMIAARTASQPILTPALRAVRRKSLECFQLPNLRTVTPRLPPSPTTQPLNVVIIKRRRRRILRDSELIEGYVASTTEATSAAKAAGKVYSNTTIVDPTTGYPLRILHVVLEFLTLRQQIALISDADVLIGTMGAGQCWMMYMRPQSVVVELHSSIVMHCTGRGINHERLKCDYSKQSAVNGINHIGFQLKIEGYCPPLQCDGSLPQAYFNKIMAAALCSVGKNEHQAPRQCTALLPPLNWTDTPTEGAAPPTV